MKITKATIISLVLVLSIFLINCSTRESYIIENRFDEFTKTRTIAQRNNYIKYLKHLSQDCLLESLEMNINLYIKNKKIDPSLFVNVILCNWLFIPKGYSLQFLIDGELIKLYTNKDSYRDVYSGFVSEIIFYDINKEKMLKIANGNNVKARLHVKDYVIPQDVKDNWKTFINQYWQ